MKFVLIAFSIKGIIAFIDTYLSIVLSEVLLFASMRLTSFKEQAH